MTTRLHPAFRSFTLLAVAGLLSACGAGSTTLKNISFVSADGRSLRLGGSGTPDADGYPTVLNATVYTKQ
jgi:hypothetical protein